MRVRPLLTAAFLAATLLPALFFGGWAVQQGIQREFADVEDRHLLLARNLGMALERYHVDLESAVEAAATALTAPEGAPDLSRLLTGLNIECVYLVGRRGAPLGKTMATSPSCASQPAPATLEELLAAARPGSFAYSPVVAGPDDNNVIYAALDRGAAVAVARIDTGYFMELGSAISFGVKGHAAIVDHEGNVLSHPLPDWIAERKNIAKVSAVARMMRGETGIEQFYSPALKGDMIAGLTAVSGPGWGVMIPQPVNELYGKVFRNNQSILAAIGLALLLSLVLVAMLFRKLVWPIESMIAKIGENAKKGQLEHIALAARPVAELENFVGTYNRMIDKVRASNAKIVELAHTDLVTGLANRSEFHRIIDRQLEEGASGALAFIDIDDFKEINDLHGHQKGDEILRAFASELSHLSRTFAQGHLGKTPIVCRVGGDEFAIVMPGMDSPERLERYLDGLLAAVSRIGPDLGLAAGCSASIGCSFYPAHGETLTELMRHADIAMYQAKKAGKNAAQIYDPATDSLTETEIRADFAQAIEEGELVLEYQPKVCTRRKAVAGAEALVRWNHPRLGRLGPNVWLPAIAGTPMMTKLGDWVFETAMKDQRAWQEAGYSLTVAVNFSSDQFAGMNFAGRLTEMTDRAGSDPGRIYLEITEDALFSDVERAARTLDELKEKGFKIALDDFGKGYSNLARLAQLPIDFIKIDHTLIAGATADARVALILDTTVEMAKNLGCKIVAEGIETREFAELATSKGANLLQGYFFAGSMSPTDLIAWIDAAEYGSLAAYRGALKAA